MYIYVHELLNVIYLVFVALLYTVRNHSLFHRVNQKSKFVREFLLGRHLSPGFTSNLNFTDEGS